MDSLSLSLSVAPLLSVFTFPLAPLTHSPNSATPSLIPMSVQIMRSEGRKSPFRTKKNNSILCSRCQLFCNEFCSRLSFFFFPRRVLTSKLTTASTNHKRNPSAHPQVPHVDVFHPRGHNTVSSAAGWCCRCFLQTVFFIL